MNNNCRVPSPKKHPIRWGQGLALCLAATTVPCAALAAEYSAQPSVTLQETYNDNIRMRQTPQNSVTGTILAPQLNLAARSARWRLGTDLRWRAARYHGIEGLDSNDRSVNVSSQIQSERSALQIGGGRARNSLLTGETAAADVGLVKSQSINITNSANASWNWSLTEKDRFSLGYQYANVTYEDSATTSLNDYSQRGPNASFMHRLSERAQLSLQASSNKFTVPELEQSALGQNINYLFAASGGTRTLSLASTTNTLRMGIDYTFSETLEGGLSAGTRKTSSDSVKEKCESGTIPIPPSTLTTCRVTSTATETTESRGSVYNASLAKNFAATRLSARAERAVDPSGAGAIVQRDTLSLGLQWSKTERLVFLFSAQGDKIRALEGTTLSVDRNLYFIEPGLQWRISEDSGISLTYRYSYLWYLSEADNAHSNSVSLTFNQAWRRRSLSR